MASTACISVFETFPDDGGVRGGKEISWDSWSLYLAPCCGLYLLTSCGAKVVLGRTGTAHRKKA